jgi:DNA-binding CsgD family transcriptional regulator
LENEESPIMEKPLSDLIIQFTASNEVNRNWELLNTALEEFGFDRVIYGKKLNPSLENLHNFSKSILLSSYGPELDEAYVNPRLYVDSPSLRWAMKNYGMITWEEMQRLAVRGELTNEEVSVINKTKELGLEVGITYSVPAYSQSYRSAFGLAFRKGGTQKEANAVWSKNRTFLEGALCAFDLTFAHFRSVPEGNELDQKTLETFSLIAEGRSNQEIAELEGCHPRTIETRLAKARERLGANNTLHALILAKDQGQIY